MKKNHIKGVKTSEMINCKRLERWAPRKHSHLMVDDNVNELIFTPEIE